MSKYAYVWLLMKGDKYMPGIFTSAYSVKKTESKCDLVVMVTKDVSVLARKELSKIMKVIEIDYLTYQSEMKMSDKQLKMYSSWATDAYTKWQCLSLNYDKILFLDADILVLKNMDHLFELNTPAAIINDTDFKMYPNTKKDSLGRLEFNTFVDATDLKNNLFNQGVINGKGMVINASCVLLSPSKEAYNGYLKMMEPYKKKPYGHNCASMYDEQSLVEFYLDKPWHVISKNYSLIPWHPEGYGWDEIYAYHYAYIPKIWLLDASHPNQQYNDVKIWANVQLEAEKKYNTKFDHFIKRVKGDELKREE